MISSWFKLETGGSGSFSNILCPILVEGRSVLGALPKNLERRQYDMSVEQGNIGAIVMNCWTGIIKRDTGIELTITGIQQPVVIDVVGEWIADRGVNVPADGVHERQGLDGVQNARDFRRRDVIVIIVEGSGERPIEIWHAEIDSDPAIPTAVIGVR